MKFFKDIFTDNVGDFDIVSVMAAAAVLMLFIFEGWQLYKGEKFDMVNFGISASSLIASLGGAYHFKANKGPQ